MCLYIIIYIHTSFIHMVYVYVYIIPCIYIYVEKCAKKEKRQASDCILTCSAYFSSLISFLPSFLSPFLPFRSLFVGTNELSFWCKITSFLMPIISLMHINSYGKKGSALQDPWRITHWGTVFCKQVKEIYPWKSKCDIQLLKAPPELFQSDSIVTCF